MTKQLLAVFKHVGTFLGVDREGERRQALETELHGLIAPHIAVLVHQREKLLAGQGQERWSDELESFMHQRVWPLLTADKDYAERNWTFATLIVDVAIEREQRRVPQNCSVRIPLVSRFDASWAN